MDILSLLEVETLQIGHQRSHHNRMMSKKAHTVLRTVVKFPRGWQSLFSNQSSWRWNEFSVYPWNLWSPCNHLWETPRSFRLKDDTNWGNYSWHYVVDFLQMKLKWIAWLLPAIIVITYTSPSCPCSKRSTCIIWLNHMANITQNVIETAIIVLSANSWNKSHVVESWMSCSRPVWAR